MANVVDAQEDEVVQRLVSQGPHEPLDVGAGVRRSIGNRQAINSNYFVQPAIEVAAVAAGSSVSLHFHRRAELSEDAVVVVDEESRSLPPCRRRSGSAA